MFFDQFLLGIVLPIQDFNNVTHSHVAGGREAPLSDQNQVPHPIHQATGSRKMIEIRTVTKC